MNIIYVLLPIPNANGAYAYKAESPLPIGSIVEVPLGNRKSIGVVWEKTDDKQFPIDKIKPIKQVLDIPPLNNDLIKIIKFISGYNITYLGLVLKMIMPNNDILLKKQTEKVYAVGNIQNQKITEKRQAVIDELSKQANQTQKQLSKIASPAVIKSMLDSGILSQSVVDKSYSPKALNPNHTKIKLNDEQQQAVIEIKKSLGSYNPFLLDGVTGSGKTEVYFELIADLIGNDPTQQTLILLPEIALSSQWAERFETRFGTKPAIWHSEISIGKKQQIWNGLQSGNINVVVGARSALFLPFTNLKLIVVDEEHDYSYKQEDTVFYNARDIAIYRANINNCPIVLASATPSLETWANAVNGKYQHLKLSARFGTATPPVLKTIDLTAEKLDSKHFIAETLHNEIESCLNAGKQALLFLNRKGYAPLTLCNKCGFRHQCNNCNSWLVEHKRTGALHCHHCDYNIPQTDTCPECGGDEMRACGAGVERTCEEIQNRFPKAKVFIATSENINSRGASQKFVDDMNNGNIDIVIGTQVVAKGYDFDNLELVGVIDGDIALGGDDLRASERTFQVIHQVAGRAGRTGNSGRAFIQTANPNHPVITALVDNDRNNFLSTELKYREMYNQPPLTRFIGIIISDFNESKCQTVAKDIVINAPRVQGMKIMGPTAPQMAFLRGKHRRRILINIDKDIKFNEIFKQWLGGINKTSTTRITIDVDPYNFI